MTLSPTLIAGHKAVTELLAGKNVRIKDPEQSSMEFVMFMRTHSVNVACWNTDVVVTWVGANDLDSGSTSVAYQALHDDPVFKDRLGEVLLPVVEEYLSRLPVSR